MTDIVLITQRLQSLPPKERVSRRSAGSKTARLLTLMPHLRELHAKGYTWVEVRDELAKDGLDVSIHTLREAARKKRGS